MLSNEKTLPRNRMLKSKALLLVAYISSALVFAAVVFIISVIAIRGLPGISWELVSNGVSYLGGVTGILPNILNTVYIVLMTLLLVLPIGIGASVYIVEYSKNKKAAALIELAAQTLAGIPSIIYGLAGMLIFVRTFNLGRSLLAGALTLAVMTLPTVIKTVSESLRAVPMSYREGALALGAGKWFALRTAVLPSAIDGIVTGCILSVGRIVGESAALLFTAGLSNEIYSIFEALTPNHAGATLSVALYVYAKERADTDTAFAIAFILLILTAVINALAKFAGKKLKKEDKR